MAHSKEIKILLVQEQPLLAGIYQLKLRAQGFLASVAADGLDALKKISEEKFDTMLLDVMLPKLSGLAVLKKIRNSRNREIASLPIIMHTNFGSRSELETVLQMGASDYIIKNNFTPSEVVEKIKKHIYVQSK
jgi:DNA-binding response OmpR family regulator